MQPFTKFKRTSFFGRPYEELLRCFGYNEVDLIGRTVLECPSGPSSFVARANAVGIKATGVDPVFNRTPSALKRLAYTDFEDMYRKIRAKPEFFVAKTYPSIEESEKIRGKAMEAFLVDYGKMYPHGRYLAASLPKLPFPNDSYDVVLCGHLLFVYEELLDLDFCVESLYELCRISREEVRVHPVVDISGKRHEQIEAVMHRLGRAGHKASIVAVEHEFFRGANRTLQIQVGRERL